MPDFVCNICGTGNTHAGETFQRETQGCGKCGSSLRTRALMGALSMELFGLPLALPEFPRVKSLRGLGTSDNAHYANRLAEVFDYRNTFYDREPRFDLAADSGEIEKYDFIVSSDVFEHVPPPAEAAFRNVRRMLKPNGLLLFTVPYELDEGSEHFPELHEYGLAEVGDSTVLVNRTRAGELQVAGNLNFHLSGTGRSLEMRVFSEPEIKEVLRAAGFGSVRVHSANYKPFGIVSAEAWSLPIAARKGPAAYGIESMRDVVDEWLGLRKSIALSKWCKLGRRLGLLRF